jgi:cobalt/nickel transport system permease protein
MHIPDGFIDTPTSLAAGALAVGGLAVAVKRGAKELDDKQIPMAGLVSAFVFATQMLNFPVVSGTSGHLLGGVLAAVLVGPWLGALCIAVVLLVQALMFADGGLSALGLNVVNMALVGTWGGYAVFTLARKVLPRVKTAVVAASGVAAFASVPLAAVAFSFEYLVGGQGGASFAAVFTAMVGVHALIGIGEGIITGLAVGSVMAVRPDLVYGARDLTTTVTLRLAPLTVERPATGPAKQAATVEP